MRILHVYPTISRPLGWAAEEVRGLCGGQVRLGHTVDLVTTNVDFGRGTLDVPTNSVVNENGVSIQYFPLDQWTRPLGRYRFQTFCYSSALKTHVVRSAKLYDIIHIHTMWSYVTIAAAWASRQSNCPYVVSVMGALDPFRSELRKRVFFSLFHRRDLERAGAVHFLSEGELETANTFQFDGTRVVIPFGIDITRYEPSTRRGHFRLKHPDLRDAKIICYLGRLSTTKGLDLLVRAFARVAYTNSQVHLVLVGPDYENFAAQLRAIAAEELITDRISILGELSEEEKIEALVDSDLFAFPSYTEAFGVALVEAMCCRVPAVVTDTLALAPLLAKRDAALVVLSDIGSVARGIERVLQDPSLAIRLATNAHSLVASLWDWPRIVDATLSVYDAVLTSKMHPAKSSD